MLHIPAGGNGFGLSTDSQTGRPSTSFGTALTVGVGSKGAWAQISAGLADAAYGLLICLNNNAASATSRGTVVDIGIGAAGSEIVLIPDLICGNAMVYSVLGSGAWYYFPVLIPAGVRVAARAQSSSASAVNVFIQAMQRPLDPAIVKAAAFVEAIGMTLPNGQAVTAGTTAEGAWTLLGTTARPCWSWQVGVQVTSADTAHAANVYHIDLAVGDGTTFDTLMDSVAFATNTAEQSLLLSAMHRRERPLPAGSDIYARAQSSGNPEPLYIAAYGAGG